MRSLLKVFPIDSPLQLLLSLFRMNQDSNFMGDLRMIRMVIHIQNQQYFGVHNRANILSGFSALQPLQPVADFDSLGRRVYGSYSSWAHAILIDTSAWVALQRRDALGRLGRLGRLGVEWPAMARLWLLKIRAAHSCRNSGRILNI